MPLSKYYKGKGEEVMHDMQKRYGKKKGKEVFYATANKRKSNHNKSRAEMQARAVEGK